MGPDGHLGLHGGSIPETNQLWNQDCPPMSLGLPKKVGVGVYNPWFQCCACLPQQSPMQGHQCHQQSSRCQAESRWGTSAWGANPKFKILKSAPTRAKEKIEGGSSHVTRGFVCQLFAKTGARTSKPLVIAPDVTTVYHNTVRLAGNSRL
eukprot:1204891-Amphidinium_carterae.1